jgi:hypothetical protein
MTNTQKFEKQVTALASSCCITPCSAGTRTHHGQQYWNISVAMLIHEGWKKLVGFCRAESWEDFVDFVMSTLRDWVEETPLFRPNFRLHVQEYVNLCVDVSHVAFRWNFFRS